MHDIQPLAAAALQMPNIATRRAHGGGNIACPTEHGFVLCAPSPDRRRLRGLHLGLEHGGWSGWLDELYVLPAWREAEPDRPCSQP